LSINSLVGWFFGLSMAWSVDFWIRQWLGQLIFGSVDGLVG